MKYIKIGLVGYGKGGRIYNAPIIDSVEGFKITKIMTTDPLNIAAAREDFPDAEIVSKIVDITSDPSIELVVITTPNHLHKKLAKKALAAGKHVVVEKPFTPTAKEADELISLAKKKNLILSVNHNRRWDSDFLTVQKLLAEKKLGEIVDYEAHFDRFRAEVPGGWKEDKKNPGSGILYDLGSHLIDQALVLFGNPKEVFADLRSQRKNAEVPDNFEVLLFYPNLKVSLNGGMLVNLMGPTFAVHGRKGSFLKFGDDPQEKMLKTGLKPNGNWGWGMEAQEIWGKYNLTEESGTIESEVGDYRKFYQNILAAIKGKEELIVKPEQARDVIKIIELAIQSNEEKRRVEFQ